jgi:transcriptional regulator with XRE-family HTH domain
MGKLDDQVRARIAKWLRAQMTQAEFGRRIGRNDSWVTRYLDENHDADLDTIKKMAEACGHTLYAVLDAVPPDDEGEVIELYRSIRKEGRQTARDALKLMSGTARPDRIRKPRDG